MRAREQNLFGSKRKVFMIISNALLNFNPSYIFIYIYIYFYTHIDVNLGRVNIVLLSLWLRKKECYIPEKEILC